jgi:hypothetical protein
MRVLTSVVGYVTATGFEPKPGWASAYLSSPAWLRLLGGVWDRADATLFMKIAEHGYRDVTESAFFPFYPMAIGALRHGLGVPPLLGALVISNFAALAAFYFLHEIAKLELGESAAKRVVWYQALFPGSVFLFAPFTEGPFLCFATGAWLAARRGQWIWAGILGAAVTLTRNTGVLILLPLALIALPDVRKIGPRLAWLGLIPAAIGGVMAFFHFKFGGALSFIHQQAAWQREATYPWKTLWMGLEQAWAYGASYPGAFYVLEAAALLAILALGVAGLRRLPAYYSIFLFASLVPALTAPFPGHVLMCFLRFLCVQFPAFLALGALVKKDSTDQFLRLSLAMLYALGAALFVHAELMF